ncbi:MAG: molybdate transporter subunit [Pseudomonadota bacterium]|jgi:molybdate transport system ATP-binding protein
MIDVRVKHQFPGFALDVAFRAPQKGITAIYGRSGSGKTTVLRAMAGDIAPDEGRIAIGSEVFFDRATDVNKPVHLRRIGYVFQESRLFPHLSVKSNLLYGAKRVTGEKSRTLEDVMDLLDIGTLLDRRIHALSGGERQRVAIGRALLAEPQLLLMDEPLSSLDPARKSELLPYIESLRDDLGLPVIYISHAFNEIIRIADHLVIVDQGRVVRSGPLLDLAAAPELSPYLGRFEAGSVIECTLARHEPSFALTMLSFSGGELRVPQVDLAAGERVRVRIRARDVALARAEPTDISIANRLPGKIASIAQLDGPYADVVVDCGGTAIRALITRESIARLKLEPGQTVWVLIKTVAFDSRSVGFRRRPRTATLKQP